MSVIYFVSQVIDIQNAYQQDRFNSTFINQRAKLRLSLQYLTALTIEEALVGDDDDEVEEEEDVYVEMLDTYYYNTSSLEHEAMSVVVAFKLIEQFKCCALAVSMYSNCNNSNMTGSRLQERKRKRE